MAGVSTTSSLIQANKLLGEKASSLISAWLDFKPDDEGPPLSKHLHLEKECLADLRGWKKTGIEMKAVRTLLNVLKGIKDLDELAGQVFKDPPGADGDGKSDSDENWPVTIVGKKKKASPEKPKKVTSVKGPKGAKTLSFADLLAALGVNRWTEERAPFMVSIYTFLFGILNKLPTLAVNLALASGLFVLLWICCDAEGFGTWVRDTLGHLPGLCATWWTRFFRGLSRSQRRRSTRHCPICRCPECPSCLNATVGLTFDPASEDNEDRNVAFRDDSVLDQEDPPAAPPVSQFLAAVFGGVLTIIGSKLSWGGNDGGNS